MLGGHSDVINDVVLSTNELEEFVCHQLQEDGSGAG